MCIQPGNIYVHSRKYIRLNHKSSWLGHFPGRFSATHISMYIYRGAATIPRVWFSIGKELIICVTPGAMSDTIPACVCITPGAMSDAIPAGICITGPGTSSDAIPAGFGITPAAMSDTMPAGICSTPVARSDTIPAGLYHPGSSE